MLRQGRLYLVAAAAASLLWACAPTTLRSSDSEPVTPDVVEQLAARVTALQPSARVAAWEAAVVEHPGSWMLERRLQDARRQALPPDDYKDLYRRRAGTQGDALSWYLAGRAHMDEPEVAAAALDKSHDLDPRAAWPVIARAVIFRRAGDLFGAVDAYERGIVEAPRSLLLRTFVAELYLDLMLPTKALEHVQVAQRIAPDAPRVLGLAGRTFAALDQPDRALSLLRRAHAAEPDLGGIQIPLARLLLNAGEVDEAQALYHRGLELGADPVEELAVDLHTAIRLRDLQRQGAR